MFYWMKSIEEGPFCEWWESISFLYPIKKKKKTSKRMLILTNDFDAFSWLVLIDFFSNWISHLGCWNNGKHHYSYISTQVGYVFH